MPLNVLSRLRYSCTEKLLYTGSEVGGYGFSSECNRLINFYHYSAIPLSVSCNGCGVDYLIEAIGSLNFAFSPNPDSNLLEVHF